MRAETLLIVSGIVIGLAGYGSPNCRRYFCIVVRKIFYWAKTRTCGDTSKNKVWLANIGNRQAAIIGSSGEMHLRT